jgi:hypothetical protein
MRMYKELLKGRFAIGKASKNRLKALELIHLNEK